MTTLKSKYNRKSLKIQGFNTKNHVFLGIVWPIVGSKGNKYEVEMHETGFSCTCIGFSVRGSCKHIPAVHERLMDENYPLYRM